MNPINHKSQTVKPFRTVVVVGLTALITLASSRAPAQTAPTRVSAAELNTAPYVYSGMIWNNTWRGSGTVARHPKIAVSCAHVIFDQGTWLRGHSWANRYHSATPPAGTASEKFLRAYWVFTSYASNPRYNEDFVVHYAYEPLAGNGYAGTSYVPNNGFPAITDTITYHPLSRSAVDRKRIIGYPTSDSSFMNSTGPFTSDYVQWGQPYYLWNTAVKGGKGMSGGGVFVDAGSPHGWVLAGVHVSGKTDGSLGAGARALDTSAYNLMTSAINAAEAARPWTLPYWAFPFASIQDNNSTWTERTVAVAGMPKKTTGISLSLQITHTFIGDLQVNITSPSGRTLLIHNRTDGAQDNLVISNKDLRGAFNGFDPNGVWKVSVRDLAPHDVGTLDWFSFTVTAQ